MKNLNHQSVRSYVRKKTPFTVGKWGKPNRVGNADFRGGDLEIQNITDYYIKKYLPASRRTVWGSKVLGVKISGSKEKLKKLLPYLKKEYKGKKIELDKYSGVIKISERG